VTSTGDQSIGTATALLLKWRAGDKTALDRLIPLVYADLRRVARARLKRDDDHSLQPTALVHEVYLRLVDLDRMTITDRVHFFAVAARLMRQILVDHARRRKANKRGGGTMAGIDDNSPAANVALADVLDLDAALDELASFDERASRVVELRFFAGLNIEETAAAMDVSTATVERDWVLAKAWLLKRLASSIPPAARTTS
jgi:RNA polymerase sigma factor (TIGR02999 family)